MGEQGLCVKALYAEGDAVVLQAQRGADVQGNAVGDAVRQGDVVVVFGDTCAVIDFFPVVFVFDGDGGEFCLASGDAVCGFEGLLPGVADEWQVVAGAANENEAEVVLAAGRVVAAVVQVGGLDDVGRRDGRRVGDADVRVWFGLEDVGVGGVLQQFGVGAMAAGDARAAQGVAKGAAQCRADVGG